MRCMRESHGSQRENPDRELAERALLARREARGYLFKRSFDVYEPDDPELYHLVINTSLVSLEYAIDVVINEATALTEGQFQRQGQVAIPA